MMVIERVGAMLFQVGHNTQYSPRFGWDIAIDLCGIGVEVAVE